ncbi:MAG: ATP-binding cassette domain-containing protein [Bacteroidales bacterium]|nr:ATP-binding cassette domain-containing protein [Bacteroidales bacterium]
MSEKILKALMELFAIISGPDSYNKNRRDVVRSFLYRQLNHGLVQDYLGIYDSYYEKHQVLQTIRGTKRIGADSVKVLRICNDINKELIYKQKVIVLVQLFEFVKSDPVPVSGQEFEFITAISDSFYIPQEEYNLIRDFTLNTFENVPDSAHLLVVDNLKTNHYGKTRHLHADHLSGRIWVMEVRSAAMYFLRYAGESEMYLNGQIMQQDKSYALNTGTSIRNHLVRPLYFSDIVSIFNDDRKHTRTVFEAKDVSYRFMNNQTGIHQIGFREESGRLVGIMGSSGAGKSTLLNILNGTTKPARGNVLINGIDIHEEKEQVEGLIGHVSQDDLLIEELTVYQNLYYNAKLCFDNYTPDQTDKAVDCMLNSLGLYEIRNIQVGTPLNKKISGGQRKRLNIALELIREPAVLFLDEPTSGLSSRDSENIMDLLKDLTLKGKLVFVVIHQPSSDIFKMFDKLLILDTGGYLIYNGNPIDAITYFKSKVHFANWADSECHACGNVNPEQIFNIVEAPVIDEYGKETRVRKISPAEWHEFYTETNGEEGQKPKAAGPLPSISFKIPGIFKQMIVFITRDVLAKLSNMQYLIITFLEAPALALILSYLIRYFNVSETSESSYTFMENSNLPVYLFMAVIVAIFMGLTVSAEEIIKDRKMLKREAFLHLSWSGYLLSKTSVMFAISAIQALSFVLIGNTVLEIKGMYLEYWIILFSCWAASNVMGLLISDSFKTVVTIYILIPFLVIPQIILSGVIVKYEKLNPDISSPSKVPFYGELMTARWGYEALSVEQFMNNKYDEKFYLVNKAMSIAEYKKNYWVKNLENKVDYLQKYQDNPVEDEKKIQYLTLLRNEISHELPVLQSIHIEDVQGISFPYLDSLRPGLVNSRILDGTREFLKTINRIYIKIYNNANDEKDALIRELQKSPDEQEQFLELKRKYHNEKLTEFVENNNEFVRIIEYKGRLYQKIDPVYLDPEHPFIKAHFYAPRKMLFGIYYSTFLVNTLVIWCFAIAVYIILHFRLLKRFLGVLEQIHGKLTVQA